MTHPARAARRVRRAPKFALTASGSNSFRTIHVVVLTLARARPASPPRSVRPSFLPQHPDKNPGDARASEQFTQISEAYQVLADSNLRARYDRHGAAALDVNFMDAGVFFTMLFGSERFEPYIGKLALAAAASMEGSLSMHRLQIRQQKREVELAQRLVEHIRPYMDGEVEMFTESMKKEAQELLSVSFGSCLLYVVAELYTMRAQEYLGYQTSPLGLTGHMTSLRATGLSVQNHATAVGAGVRAAGAAIRTFKTVKEIADQNKDATQGGGAQGGGGGGSDPLSSLTPQQLKATQETLPIFLEAMWHLSVVDIERTLTQSISKVCRDHSVTEQQRLQRGEAIALLGAIFMEQALAVGGSKDPKEKVGEMVQMIAPHMSGKPAGPATPGAPPAGGNGSAGGDAGSGGGASARGGGGGSGGSGGAATGGAATGGAATGGAATGGVPSGEPSAVREYSLEELREMRVRDLKSLLHAYGVSEVEAVEKEELVEVVYALQVGSAGGGGL